MTPRIARNVFGLIPVLSLMAACAQMPGMRTSGIERMYVLYCGEAQIPDLSPWSPGFNVGTPAMFSDNCYLIRHAKGWLLWDSGYTDALAEKPEGLVGPRATSFRKKTLVSQMAEIGVTPGQVTHLAFSHTHADHVGNGNLFTAATLYIQQAEYDAAFGPDASKFNFIAADYDKLRANPAVKLQGDHDVFGDGSVTILATPGHTPGHQSLLVRLPKTGAVVLSGDVAHFRDNFENRRVPGFNFNREQSVASMDKIASVVKAENGQLWINHDSAQNAGIRHAPQYYE
jgi:glyoxylase-like metal-dependent hydrolase (beta-lactamase superfamily II)